GVCMRRRPRCDACPWATSCIALRRGLVDRLPAPKPRTMLPQKSTVMLALTRAGEILLEKRPPHGIWGGMWCLPEVARKTGLADHCLERFGASVSEVEELPLIAHGFTHYKLDISPLRVRVAALAPRACEPGLIWLPVDEAKEAAIPAPVKRILGLLGKA